MNVHASGMLVTQLEMTQTLRPRQHLLMLLAQKGKEGSALTGGKGERGGGR